MSWGTVSGWEALLLTVALVGVGVHGRGLRRSLADRRRLAVDGINGACRLLVQGHIRGHATRLAVNGVVILMALYLMTRAAPPTDRTAPLMITGLLVITAALMVDGVWDARDWRELEDA